MWPPVHDIAQGTLDQPIYQRLTAIFVDCAAPQVSVLIDKLDSELPEPKTSVKVNPSLQLEFCDEIARGIVSTWVSSLLAAHAQNGQMTPYDMAGKEIIDQIEQDLRHFPQIDFNALLKAALLRFAEQPGGMALPHHLHIDQSMLTKAAQLIP